MIRPNHRATATEQSSSSLPLCRGGFLSMLGMKRCAHTVFRWGFRRDESPAARRHSTRAAALAHQEGSLSDRTILPARSIQQEG